MYEYSRDVFYYETDKMGVVHHSNYARWLEEARAAYFRDANLDYTETENLGVLCPVTSLTMKFKYFARYGDTFTVRLMLTKYTGVRFSMMYEVRNSEDITLLEAQSEHAFVGRDFRPILLARAIPDRHDLMKKLAQSELNEENSDVSKDEKTAENDTNMIQN